MHTMHESYTVTVLSLYCCTDQSIFAAVIFFGRMVLEPYQHVIHFLTQFENNAMVGSYKPSADCFILVICTSAWADMKRFTV